jgi:hypothetical protein
MRNDENESDDDVARAAACAPAPRRRDPTHAARIGSRSDRPPDRSGDRPRRTAARPRHAPSAMAHAAPCAARHGRTAPPRARARANTHTHKHRHPHIQTHHVIPHAGVGARESRNHARSEACGLSAFTELHTSGQCTTEHITEHGRERAINIHAESILCKPVDCSSGSSIWQSLCKDNRLYGRDQRPAVFLIVASSSSLLEPLYSPFL